MKQPYNTALYYRLSRDDENFGDSVSIETQKTILQQFARDNQFHVVDEYIDDGWSGTNFDRPAFQRMIDDVDAGRINCIITKDLSRFGREHVMMDYYLEFVFPEKNIRYIAVTENEDTEKGLSDFVPFKNLFNEWFAKDTSRKVKAALRAKHAAGQGTGKCSMHYIRYDTLYTYVLLRVQHWTKAVREDEEKLLESILKAGDKERAAAMKKHTAGLAKAEKRKTEVDRLFAKMYEDRVSERITEYNFNMLSQKYQMEQLELDEKIQKLKAALSESKQSVEDARQWIEIVKQYSEPTELTAELLNSMINKIVVHEAVKYDNGFREQKIEIYYRFVGKID